MLVPSTGESGGSMSVVPKWLGLLQQDSCRILAVELMKSEKVGRGGWDADKEKSHLFCILY